MPAARASRCARGGAIAQRSRDSNAIAPRRRDAHPASRAIPDDAEQPRSRVGRGNPRGESAAAADGAKSPARVRLGACQLLLEKDNPSGEPANAQGIRIPVRFAVGGVDGTSKDSGVRGAATMGPTCPVERMPPDPACADKPVAATFSIDTAEGTHVTTSLPLSLDSGIR